MNLESALRALSLSDYAEVLRAGWDDAMAEMPRPVPFLAAGFVRDACSAAFLPEDLTRRVLAAAERIRSNAALQALAWYCHRRVFVDLTPKLPLNAWPVPLQAMGDEAGFFYVVALLSGTPQRIEAHRQRGIPDEIVRDTVSDLEVCIRTERQEVLGRLPGIGPPIFGWLLRHWRGDLYRLGRLQFIPGRFPRWAGLRVLRHRETGAVLALAEGDRRFRRDGLVDGSGGVSDGPDAWTSVYRETPETLTANPITPLGRALPGPVILQRREWREELAADDPILEVHIAAGAPMDYAECGESFRRAMSFFPRYFPDRPFRAFTCTSWLLDIQFERLLAPTSNLVRFQRETYLFPLPGGSGEMPWQVRRPDDRDGRGPERMTSMQRAFYAHAERGGRFFGGGCFLLSDDLDWGRQVYRTQALPWLNGQEPEHGAP